MGTALALTDLIVHGDEPRVSDLRLAEALGFDRLRKARELISRNTAELAGYGDLIEAAASTHGGTRPTAGRVYWLNEAQAVLVCMFARTPRAAEVRRQVIEVFLAWRRGELAAAAPALPLPPSEDPWSVMAGRLAALEAQIALQDDHVPHPLALAATHLPLWRNGRRPNFWADLPVRTLLTGMHRQVPEKVARELCLRRFGPARTPSSSALNRYWQLLDRARGGRR